MHNAEQAMPYAQLEPTTPTNLSISGGGSRWTVRFGGIDATGDQQQDDRFPQSISECVEAVLGILLHAHGTVLRFEPPIAHRRRRVAGCSLRGIGDENDGRSRV